MPLKALNARFGLGVFQKRQVGFGGSADVPGPAVSQCGDGALGNFAMLLVKSGPKGSPVELTAALGPNSLSIDRLMAYIGGPRRFADPSLDMETTFEREETEKGANY